ncbi:hypothetical protein PVAP13_4KG103400 [Panicum virgatum]|uniref:Uncharacterized protein n=1 Tax=Panicum virgatum TaxID=38727 RepID=A0A8T0TRE5_PANVG|nr:hypothetical protein PVAP13_4KG103400 [Panicum virgatum]
MGIHKAIFGLVLTLLVAGQLIAGVAAGRFPSQVMPTVVSSDPTLQEHSRSTLRHGGSSAEGLANEKTLFAARGYFHPPNLPPCRRSAC